MTVRQLLTSAAAAAMLLAGPLAAQTKLQIGSPLNAGSFAETYLLEFQERVAEELGEEIEVEIFMSNTLGSELDVYEGMQLGTHSAQLTATPLANINSRVAIWELPFLFADRDDVAAFVNGRPGEMLREGMEGTGMQIVAIWDGGFRVITNNVRPVVTPDDLRGMKIRVPNSSYRVKVFQALGANPTPLSFSELYTALDQGVVDGQENPAQIVLSARFTEVQDHVAISNHVYVPTHLVIADWFLESLDAETRETLISIAQDMEPWTREQGAATDAEMRERLEAEAEVTEIDLEAFQAAVAPLYEDPEFVDAIGEEMLSVTRETLGL
jgi:TRAP-type transport system periplasmic protein